ncbi:MAG: hypothetical protein CMK07_12150 [Ponticaulis sp.]|nr:hypothetical protein [Ponticaulis sp.]
MADYLAVSWRHDFEEEPDLIYYEVQEDSSVTRMVEHFKDGALVRDNLELATAREDSETPLTCLCGGQFPAADKIDQVMKPPQFDVKPIAPRRFEGLFRAARNKD